MSARSDRPAERDARIPKIVCALVVASVVGVLYVLSGESVSGRKVVFGKNWPASQLVSIAEIDHLDWDKLLRRFVDDAGDVDYAGWNESPADLQSLDDYLSALSRAEPNRESSREARLAFWINAYNALTIRGILREHPTLGLKTGEARGSQPDLWSGLFLRVGDKDYSLGQIENELLRPLRDPRVHFAIVCGSRGCPRLLNRAYQSGELEQQLRENSRCFFADPRKLEYDPSTGQLRLSPTLKSYAKDFGGSDSEILETIAPYLPERVNRRRSRTGGLRAGYLDYDWSLNEQARPTQPPPIPPDTATAESNARTEDPDSCPVPIN
jgi:hypothetical protein